MNGLEEEREFLLQSIRDLDAELAAGDLDEADHRALRDDYTARAADVLRRLEGAAPSTPPATPAPWPLSGANAPSRPRSRRKAAVGAVLLALVAGGTGYAVAASSDERLATDEATGDIVEGSTDRITKAQLLVNQGKILEAVKVYDQLIDEDPENPVALAQRGWLLVQVGEPSLVDSGLAGIERAIAVEPSYADAYFFRGMTLLRAKGEPAMAAEAFRAGLAANPPPELRAALERFGSEAEAAAAADAGASATP